MDREVLKTWAEALPKYKRIETAEVSTSGCLRIGDCYSILGVLCDLHQEKFKSWWTLAGKWKYPDLKTGEYVEAGEHWTYLGEGRLPPKAVAEWLGVEKANKRCNCMCEGCPCFDICDPVKIDDWTSQDNRGVPFEGISKAMLEYLAKGSTNV